MKRLSECPKQLAACRQALKIAESRLEQIGDAPAQLSICREELSACQSKLLPFDTSGWTEPEKVPSSDIDDTLQACIRDFDRNWEPNWEREPSVRRIVMDAEYKLPTDEEIIEYIIWSDVDGCRYKSDFKDCDKFARKFWADMAWDTEYNCAGFVVDWSGGHSYCVFQRRGRKLWMYEPQSDEWWDSEVHAYEGAYALTSALVLL